MEPEVCPINALPNIHRICCTRDSNTNNKGQEKISADGRSIKLPPLSQWNMVMFGHAAADCDLVAGD